MGAVAEFLYVSTIELTYRKGLRQAYIGEEPTPVVYGGQGKLREYYGNHGPVLPSTLDHIVAAVGG